MTDELKVWQRYHERELSQQEGEDLIANWGFFIRVVSDWQVNREAE